MKIQLQCLASGAVSCAHYAFRDGLNTVSAALLSVYSYTAVTKCRCESATRIAGSLTTMACFIGPMHSILCTP